ncbi:hypothetical protein BO71DRAFT_255800 [Aspergillus ellipticus CBS 707.79]|uniref:Uncharacterized protein n=1 Tax=Aspergillus ellipticus CBS 707.79 TaxID=1448320 RepID=A0A319D839_9EURO|nr:hypothetical protein BO71DRAFT_255800 [Aspergillus ellipticus CBS 707.79]
MVSATATPWLKVRHRRFTSHRFSYIRMVRRPTVPERRFSAPCPWPCFSSPSRSVRINPNRWGRALLHLAYGPFR